MAVLAVAQLGRTEQEEELMKHLTQCVIGAMAVLGAVGAGMLSWMLSWKKMMEIWWIGWI